MLEHDLTAQLESRLRALHGGFRQRPALALPVALAALCLAGCGREDVRVYQAPKDQAAAAAPAADPHAGLDMSSALAAPTGGTPSPAPIQWQLPAQWKELPAGQMRVGHFAVTGDGELRGEVTIIPLGGRAGNDLDNVNRWLGQLGSPALAQEQMSQLAQAVSIGGGEGQLYDLAAPEGQPAPKRTLAAILRREGTSWFFKMTGDEALVRAQKAAFVEFLKTVRFEAPARTAAGSSAVVAEAAPPQPPAGTPASPGALPPVPTPPSSGKPVLEVPATWKEQAPGSMQLAKYVPSGADGKAEITVAVLPGDGGGPAANVNRWRRQLGLAPWSETELQAALQKLTVAGAEAYLVDLANPATAKRMLAAGVLRGGQSWFYKLTGDAAAVETERAVFVRFVEGARYAP